LESLTTGIEHPLPLVWQQGEAKLRSPVL